MEIGIESASEVSVRSSSTERRALVHPTVVPFGQKGRHSGTRWTTGLERGRTGERGRSRGFACLGEGSDARTASPSWTSTSSSSYTVSETSTTRTGDPSSSPPGNRTVPTSQWGVGPWGCGCRCRGDAAAAEAHSRHHDRRWRRRASARVRTGRRGGGRTWWGRGGFGDRRHRQRRRRRRRVRELWRGVEGRGRWGEGGREGGGGRRCRGGRRLRRRRQRSARQGRGREGLVPLVFLL